jgi:hypothetical protein
MRHNVLDDAALVAVAAGCRALRELELVQIGAVMWC